MDQTGWNCRLEWLSQSGLFSACECLWGFAVKSVWWVKSIFTTRASSLPLLSSFNFSFLPSPPPLPFPFLSFFLPPFFPSFFLSFSHLPLCFPQPSVTNSPNSTLCFEVWVHLYWWEHSLNLVFCSEQFSASHELLGVSHNKKSKITFPAYYVYQVPSKAFTPI